MGDADDSYDFLELPKFVEKLREGYDLAQGCRLPSGGGTVRPGAMPRLHRWWGNPMFSAMVRTHVLGAGPRRVLRAARLPEGSLRQARPAQPGMEFATEMIIKSSLQNARIAEVPDHAAPGRPQGARAAPEDVPRRLADAALLPDVQPALAVPVSGVCPGARWARSATRWRCPGVRIGGVHFDAHTLLFSSLAILLGHQSIVFAIFAKTVAMAKGLLPPNRRMDVFFRVVTLERGLVAGVVMLAGGVVLLVLAVNAGGSTGSAISITRARCASSFPA